MIADHNIAVILALLSACLIPFGYVCHRLAVGKLRKDNVRRVNTGKFAKPYSSEIRWWAGTAIYVVGLPLGAVAFGYGAQSTFAVFDCLHIALSAVLDHFLLEDPMKRAQWVRQW